MTQNDDVVAASVVAYHYLKTRPRTEREMKRHLLRWAVKYRYSPLCVDSVIQNLRELDFLNDERFTALFVKDRTTLKPKGERTLRHELALKGVSPEIIDAFFSANPTDDTRAAERALSTKKKAYQHLEARMRFKKAISFLMRRGFGYDTAKRAYAAVFGTQNAFEENDPNEYNSDN